MVLASENKVTNNTELYNWERYWLPSSEGEDILNSKGFLYPRGEYVNTGLKTYDKISDKDYLLLIGEPGMGKTKFCDQIKTGLVPKEASQYWFKDLKNITSDTSFDKKLIRKIKKKLKRTDTDTNLYVFLDGLDEGILQYNIIHSDFIDALEDLKKYNKRLKLRITCRTYDLPRDLEEGLKRFYDDESDKSNIYRLCPLTEDNVREAAIKKNIDADKFIAEIIKKEVVPLAIRPISLDFLISEFKETESLPNEITEIYEKGLKNLCKEEHNEFRNKHGKQKTGDKLYFEDRFLVAARIAYISIFNNKPVINKINDFTGNNEVRKSFEFAVKEDEIEEVLKTQVFSNATFSHKTYAEFLAAYYLHCNIELKNVCIDALKNLFFNDLGKVHPPLKEVAVWLSRYNKEFLDLIVQNDLTILFHTNNIQLGESSKINIIDAFIKALVQGDIYNDWKRNFQVLNYRGLTDKIISELNKTTHPDTITFLIHLARYCVAKAKLERTILDIAMNHSSKDVQIEAINYLAEYGSEITHEQLIEKLKKEDFENDGHDEMRATLLRAVYNKMDFDKLLTYITNEKKPRCIAKYNIFLCYKFRKDIYNNTDHLTKTLIHFSKNVEQKNELVEKVVGRELVEAAITNISENEVEDALIEFIGSRLKLNIPNFSLETYLYYFKENTKAELNSIPKRQFLEKLIFYLLLGTDSSAYEIIEQLTRHENIIGRNDLDWILENFKNEKNGLLQDCWFGFVKKMIPNEAYSFILKYFNEIDEIYNSTSHKEFKKYYNIISKGTAEISRKAQVLKTKFENITKESEQRKKDNPRNKQYELWVKKINQLISKITEKVKSGEINQWKWLAKNDVHWFPVWKEIEEKNQIELIETAKIYIENVENKCNCKKFIFGMDCLQDINIGAAFLLLIKHEKEYLETQPKSFYDKWVERIIANKTVKHDEILKLFYSKKRERTIECIKSNFDYLVENKIEKEKAKENLENFASYVQYLEGQEINEVLYNLIINNNKLTNNLSYASNHVVMKKLLREEHPPILESIEFWASQPIKEQDYDWFSGVFANTFFIVENNQDVLNKIIQKFMDDSDFEDYFIEEKVSTDEFETKNFCYKVNKLNKKTCEKWLAHLDRRFPKRANSILGKSKIAELKDYLLRNIIQKSTDFEIISYYQN